MIKVLGGHEAIDPADVVGKEILSVSVTEDGCVFQLADGRLRIWDGGQSCCKSRYLRTDDDVTQFVGATLESMKVESGPTVEGQYDSNHEMQFLCIGTSKGVLVIETHNEHNGYYGGFAIEARFERVYGS